MLKIYVKKEDRRVQILRTEGDREGKDLFSMVYKHFIGIKQKDCEIILEK